MAKEDEPGAASAIVQAKDRVAQISSHLADVPKEHGEKANTGRARRNKKARAAGGDTTADAGAQPPADYSDILGQVSALQTMAATPDPSRRGFARQKQAGKLWVRERVEQMFDAGTVREVGSVSGTVQWRQVHNPEGGAPGAAGRIEEKPESFVPSNNVQGFALVGGRKVCFTADDYSIRAGHADGALWEKTIYMEKMCLALRLPIIKLVDGSSGGGSVTTIRTNGFSYVPPLNGYNVVVDQLNAGIPNLGAALGPAVGLGAARVVSCHFSVMAADVGSLFNAGPKVVAGATFEEGLSLRDLGGPDMHVRNGTIDNYAASEQDAFRQLHAVLSYLPNSGSQLPPIIATNDPTSRTDESLRTAIPRRKERMYDVRKIVATVVDESSFFEIGALWGTTAIVGLARLGGRPVGVVANNCQVNAGALDAAGSQKITKHLKFCDVFNLPLVQFVDVPGYAIGTVAERTATMRHGVSLVTAYYSTTMPVFNVLIRRVYGVAGAAMMDCRDPRMRVAWPSGDWGSLPLDGGIEVGHSAELKRAYQEGAREGGKEEGQRRWQELYADLERDYTRLMNPVRTANAFGIEEIIDPAVTRPLLCTWLQHVYEELLPVRLQERDRGKICPKFS
ncbi:propionyl-CoA carboxylase beta chain mitochondrial precursor [Xylariales sp. PMI_506]|nr:propionyl-CoA carboxylase beta chain mitochondrial precursor [Xylariales sp. PMI_506]